VVVWGYGVSGLSEVRARLDDLRPHPAVHRFVLELAGHESVWSQRQGGYVGLRPTLDEGPFAVYVYKDRVEVCLAPERARTYGEAISGSRLFSPTATTSHWVIPAALLSNDDAMRAAREAVAWGRDGVRARQAQSGSRAGARPARPTRSTRSTTRSTAPTQPVVVEEQCPIHFIARRICECNE
jgi:hypothetical protein